MATTKKASTKNLCLCGCGQEAKRSFLMGHDAKLKSTIRKLASGEGSRTGLLRNKRVREYLKACPWMTPEVSLAIGLK